MDIKPFPKSLFDKATLLKIERVELEFSGGNDEGNLQVTAYKMVVSKATEQQVNEFEADVNSWADIEYDYSGAGDGSDYGDNITYNFKKQIVISSDWSMVRQDSGENDEKMEVVDDATT